MCSMVKKSPAQSKSCRVKCDYGFQCLERNRTQYGQISHSIKWPLINSFLLGTAKIWDQKTFHEFYIKAITVKNHLPPLPPHPIKPKQTQFLAVLSCQNTDMSSYRIVQGRNVPFSNTLSLPICTSKAMRTFQTGVRSYLVT